MGAKETVSFIQSMGAGWFVIILFSVSIFQMLSFGALFLMLKKLFSSHLIDLLEKLVSISASRIEVDKGFELRLTELAKSVSDLLDGLLNSQRVVGAKMDNFESKVEKLHDKFDFVVKFLPKRKGDVIE